jgi:hypothetical protein
VWKVVDDSRVISSRTEDIFLAQRQSAEAKYIICLFNDLPGGTLIQQMIVSQN